VARSFSQKILSFPVLPRRHTGRAKRHITSKLSGGAKTVRMAIFQHGVMLTKIGYLFFLATGIFFGFKKPLAFFPFEVINSISYTSVLQRTFNLNIAVQLPEQVGIKEHEFSMLDQADFAGIDAYIKRHGLQDASLAESRKAKKLNLNGAKKGAEENDDDGGEQQSSLQKAQQDMEDAEDEEEEDFDPGSEDLSDGSGGSSEDEEDGDGDGGGGDGDLGAEELGSEAVEVVLDPEDDDQL
jgi:Histone chaperone Rttp106-like